MSFGASLALLGISHLPIVLTRGATLITRHTLVLFSVTIGRITILLDSLCVNPKIRAGGETG